MADTFTLTGRVAVQPASASTTVPVSPSVSLDLSESMTIGLKHETEYLLAVDGATAVAFGGLSSAHVLMIKTSGKVIATLTSADGAAQTVPVDGFLLVVASSVPYTALSLTRVAGVPTTARVLLAQKSSS